MWGDKLRITQPHKLKGKWVTGLMPGTAVWNNTYRRGDFVTWQCIPPNGDCPQAQFPVPWWGSGARISAELRSRCRPADVQLSRTIYTGPPAATARRLKRPPRASVAGPARLSPSQPRVRTRFAHKAPGIKPVTMWGDKLRTTQPHKPKGKRVTGLMLGTAVRNNIYRRGDFVTWHKKSNKLVLYRRFIFLNKSSLYTL